MRKIVVTAAKDRLVPIHASVATAPGRALLCLRPGDELRVDAALAFVHRALGRGDLEEVKAPRLPVDLDFLAIDAELPGAKSSAPIAAAPKES